MCPLPSHWHQAVREGIPRGHKASLSQFPGNCRPSAATSQILMDDGVVEPPGRGLTSAGREAAASRKAWGKTSW